MRMTLTVDDDLAAQLQQLRKQRSKSLKSVVNDVIRQGLNANGSVKRKKRRFVVQTFDLGPSLIGSLDNIGEVLERIEGPLHK